VVKAAAGEGFCLQGLAPSALRGSDGNIEFFGWWKRGEAIVETELSEWIEEAVREAWREA
jgi:hypothetical protein